MGRQCHNARQDDSSNKVTMIVTSDEWSLNDNDASNDDDGMTCQDDNEGGDDDEPPVGHKSTDNSNEVCECDRIKPLVSIIFLFLTNNYTFKSNIS